ncbi:hypothetical protein J3R83DRAFT_850 [Lanmaoa asiatica]|nr:hypothetical protein J3R83DRAFT_850 [Lanmaoa asiatica]
MSFPRSPSPPPPMPSPVLVPIPLTTPPRRLARQSHPSLPSLVLRKTLNHTLSHDALHRAATTPDDAPRAENTRRSPFSSPRTLKRTHSHLPSRCRSPPPSPAIRSPPPPVPPIPAFLLTTNHSIIRPSRQPAIPNRAPPFDLYLDHSREDSPNMYYESRAGGALTCMQFFAVHNPTGQCHP